MSIDKKEFSRLSPEERIKKLRLMEEERKKEVTEIGQLIKDSMKEIKTDKLAAEIAPEQKSVDISRLFEPGEGQNLERAVGRGATASPVKGRGYQLIAQSYQDYSQLKSFYGIVATGGNLSKEQVAAIDQIGARINMAESYVTEGEKTAGILDASRATLRKLKKETGLG